MGLANGSRRFKTKAVWGGSKVIRDTEEEETNETLVDVQVWWEGLRDHRLAETSEVGLGEVE